MNEKWFKNSLRNCQERLHLKVCLVSGTSTCLRLVTTIEMYLKSEEQSSNNTSRTFFRLVGCKNTLTDQYTAISIC